MIFIVERAGDAAVRRSAVTGQPRIDPRLVRVAAGGCEWAPPLSDPEFAGAPGCRSARMHWRFEARAPQPMVHGPPA